METKCKLLVIGLDAATFDLILPWAAEGRLPRLAELLARGAHGALTSVPNLNSLAAWTTFMTGKNPGRHGVFWFYEHAPDSYALRFLNGSDIADARFWEIASDAGRQVGIINVPMTYPATPLHGFLIAGMDAPDESSPGFTYPPKLYKVLRRLGGYRIDTNILGYARSGRLRQAIAATERVIAWRERAADYLMRTRSWDLFVVVFTALDRVQHAFWQEPGPPASSAGSIVRRFYERLDQAIGRLCDTAGEETTVVIVSDHGMGFNPQSNLYLNPWLESLGLFRPARGTARSRARAALRRVSAWADGLLSKPLRRRILRWLPGGRAGLVGQLHRAPCDWAHTRAYADYIQPGIWINLRGREPHGIVEPGAEYEALRTRLIEMLSRCRDPRTGTPIVRRVCRREEVYQGPHVSKAPDLHIEWSYAAVACGYQYEDDAGHTVTVGQAADMVERRNVTGDHRPEGILLLAGPQVRREATVRGAQMADIAPTLCYLLGLPVPEDMEGRVLVEALEETYLEAHPVIRRQAAAAGDQERRELSAEEARQVEERLRGLGYLD